MAGLLDLFGKKKDERDMNVTLGLLSAAAGALQPSQTTASALGGALQGGLGFVGNMQQRRDAQEALNRRLNRPVAVPAGGRMWDPVKKDFLTEPVFRPSKPSALQESVNSLVNAGVPENLARKIRGGAMKVSQDPITRAITVTDIGSVPPKIVWQSQASGSIPPSSLAPPEPPRDPAAATGLSGALANIANTVSTMIGAQPIGRDAEQATHALNTLGVRTWTALQAAIPGRPSVFTQQEIKDKLTVSPNSIFQGQARAKTKLRETRDMMTGEINRIERDILSNPGSYTPAQIATSRANVSELKALRESYTSILNKWGKGGKAGPKKIMGQSDYNKLKSGELYTAPDGTVRRKR